MFNMPLLPLPPTSPADTKLRSSLLSTCHTPGPFEHMFSLRLPSNPVRQGLLWPCITDEETEAQKGNPPRMTQSANRSTRWELLHWKMEGASSFGFPSTKQATISHKSFPQLAQPRDFSVLSARRTHEETLTQTWPGINSSTFSLSSTPGTQLEGELSSAGIPESGGQVEATDSQTLRLSSFSPPPLAEHLSIRLGARS
jgi:hypothetical protein